MTAAITQTFIPGPRLIDGSDLNNLVTQMNSALGIDGDYPAITALTTVGAGTIAAAGIAGQITARGGAQAGSAFTDTTDTAVAIVAAFGTSLPVGAALYWVYSNATDAQATLAAGSGVTLSGNTIVPKLTWASYLVTKTSATAVTVAFVSAGALAPLPPFISTAQTNTTTLTISASGLTTAQLSQLVLSGGSQKTMAFPIATDIVAATPNVRVGQQNQLLVRNTSSVTLTLSGLTGTIVSTLAAIQPSTATLASVTIDSLASVTITGLTNTQIAV